MEYRNRTEINCGGMALSIDLIRSVFDKMPEQELKRTMKLIKQYGYIIGGSGYEHYLKKEGFVEGLLASHLLNLSIDVE